MKIKTINFRYIPFSQQPYCCVPANLQMILYRRNLPLLSQEDIGYDLGLMVPEKYFDVFPRVRKWKKPSSGWGTQIEKEEFSLNNFFIKHNYPLRYQYFFPTMIENDLKNWMKQHIENGDDIIVCFHYKHLYKSGNDGWHVCLVEKIENEIITLIETEANLPKFRTVKFQDLLDSMIYHWAENSGGFWLIRDI